MDSFDVVKASIVVNSSSYSSYSFAAAKRDVWSVPPSFRTVPSGYIWSATNLDPTYLLKPSAFYVPPRYEREQTSKSVVANSRHNILGTV